MNLSTSDQVPTVISSARRGTSSNCEYRRGNHRRIGTKLRPTPERQPGTLTSETLHRRTTRSGETDVGKVEFTGELNCLITVLSRLSFQFYKRNMVYCSDGKGTDRLLNKIIKELKKMSEIKKKIKNNKTLSQTETVSPTSRHHGNVDRHRHWRTRVH